MELNDKVALIVGGASGIGLCIAKTLAAEGAKVAIADVNEQALRAAAEKSGGALHWKVCDVTNREQVAGAVSWLTEELGPVDILVNSAGINVANRFMHNINPPDFDKVFAVNTTGTFNMMHAVLPVMREKKSGLIINIVSMAGVRTYKLAGMPYAASKFANVSMGNWVNLEDGMNGIRVTSICPGEVNTPIVEKRAQVPTPEQRAAMLQPEDIAACVVMIAKLPPRAVVSELIVTNPYMPYA